MKGGVILFKRNKLENYDLWNRYKKNKDQSARNELIVNYLNLVKYQASRVKMLVPDFVDIDDLESYGVLGLFDAIEKFDINYGVKFSTYANKRIKGEIIDRLRKMDWLPDQVRNNGQKMKKIIQSFLQELGRKPTLSELADALNISKEQVRDLYYKIYSAEWVSLYSDGEENPILNIIESNFSDPENNLNIKITEDLLTEAINRLTKQEKLIIVLYYYEDLSLTEIANIMELSNSRISKIHKKAIYRLRGFLSNKKEELF
ncbi:MAG: sigma-70 family RNA polymerase sigma factor [bacterium]